MHDILIAYINSQLITKMSEDEIEIIKKTFVLKKLRKHQFLLQRGEVCNFAGFIIKGALKQYTIDEKGNENILALLIENWWASDRESFAKEEASPFYIDAYENTELLLVNKEDFINNLSKLPALKELSRILTEKQALQLIKRVHTINTMNAEDKYADFEINYPELLQT